MSMSGSPSVPGGSARGEPGDIVVLRTPSGLRFQLLRGEPEGDEVAVLAEAIDRMAAWDEGQELGAWVRGIRPGIGRHAWQAGRRWGDSLRSGWGEEV
ncbi:MAG TPA: hypothetical protein VF995_04745 [Actinomycetota bacterium]